MLLRRNIKNSVVLFSTVGGCQCAHEVQQIPWDPCPGKDPHNDRVIVLKTKFAENWHFFLLKPSWRQREQCHYWKVYLKREQQPECEGKIGLDSKKAAGRRTKIHDKRQIRLYKD